MRKARFLLVAALRFLAGCADTSSASPDTTAAVPSTVGTTDAPAATLLASVPASCPVTVPGYNGFTPSEESPEGPPQSYGLVWYGMPALWTMIPPEGQVWQRPHGDKFFWWSENYGYGEWTPEIALTAVRTDGTGPTVEAGSPGTNGQHPDIGDFMLVGMEIPEPGCWKVTADYKGASLSYTMWIDGG
jgi:hypothetical protein